MLKAAYRPTYLVKALPLALALLAPAAVKAGTYTFTDTSSNIENLSHGTAYTWGLTNTTAGSTGANLGALETAVKSGQTITSVTVTLSHIWDWTSEPDDVLYVNILNLSGTMTGDNSLTYNNNPNTTDTSYGTDPFVVGTTGYNQISTLLGNPTTANMPFTPITAGSNQTASLLVASGLPNGDPGTWTDPVGGEGSAAAPTITITLTAANIGLLDSYLLADSTSGGDVGLGFGPDCHFYDSGVTLTVTTAAASGHVPDNGSTLIALGMAILGLAGFRRFARRSVVA